MKSLYQTYNLESTMINYVIPWQTYEVSTALREKLGK